MLSTISGYIVGGITQGCVYALLGSGLSLIWGTMKLMNFAQGEFYMVGGYAVYVFATVLNVPAILAIILAIIAASLVGVAFHLGVLRWLLDREEWELPAIVATLGLSIGLQSVALHVYGADVHNINAFWSGATSIGGVVLVHQRILIFAATVVAFAALAGILKFTRIGVGIRALSQDRVAAVHVGIRPAIVYTVTLVLSVALAGLGGAMLAPVLSVSPTMGQGPLLMAFVVVVVGGLGSIWGAAIAGIGMGLIESIGVALISSSWVEVIAFVILIIFLYTRPQGLLGKARVA